MQQKKNNTALWIVLAVLGAFFMVIVLAAGVIAVAVVANQKGDERAAARSSTEYTTTTPAPWDTTTTTTTPAVTLYGGIAYSGAGGAFTRSGEVDGYAAKDSAVKECNQELWNVGWPSDTSCGYVSLTSGECGSVARAKAPSGWGPTGWATGPDRAQVTATALQKCNSVGQGACYELTTLCI